MRKFRSHRIARAAHGLKRFNRDKRNAVDKMLNDPVVCLNDDGVPWSDSDIARRCVVSHTFVASRRPQVTCNVSSERAYTTKHGTTSTMTVSNIGARPNGTAVHDGTGWHAAADPAPAREWQQTDIEDFAPTPARLPRFTPAERSEAGHIRYFLGEIDRRLTLPPAKAAAAFVGEIHSDAGQVARVVSWLTEFEGELHAEMSRREGSEAAD